MSTAERIIFFTYWLIKTPMYGIIWDKIVLNVDISSAPINIYRNYYEYDVREFSTK